MSTAANFKMTKEGIIPLRIWNGLIDVIFSLVIKEFKNGEVETKPGGTNLATKDYSSAIKEVEDRLDIIEPKIETLETKVTTLEGKVTTLEGKVSTLETEMDAAQAAISSLQTSVTNLNNAVIVLQGQLGSLIALTAGLSQLPKTDAVTVLGKNS